MPLSGPGPVAACRVRPLPPWCTRARGEEIPQDGQCCRGSSRTTLPPGSRRLRGCRRPRGPGTVGAAAGGRWP
ncbi:TPA_asm: UL7.5 uORF [Human alphaherpesvirus 1]|nr:TPA_asm: UL7.5 uORF [Human alphaherpesvirus 1]